ncbi:MAG TPA: ORF6N domain-containing protein [Puia sp.]|nr:ORF6N domain-containing protein [Puia sp.]
MKAVALAEEAIISKIYLIRGKKAMLDRDLAELYGVETRVLNQAVRRNEKRFPDDFMFQLTTKELEGWKSQTVISNKERMGLRTGADSTGTTRRRFLPCFRRRQSRITTGWTDT